MTVQGTWMNPAGTQASGARPARPGGEAGAVVGFFRYHGVWAPGVRLFRGMGFRGKAMVISLAFLLPMGWLALNYFQHQQADISFAAEQRLGVAYVRGAMPLLQALQQQRLVAVQATAAGRPATGADEARLAVQAALRPLAEVQARLGSALHTQQAHAAVLLALQALPAETPPDAALKAHSALIGLVAVRAALHGFHDVAAASESAARVSSAGGAALEGLRAAQLKSLHELDGLLQARIAGLEAARDLTAGALLLSLALVWYLFSAFRRVLEGGLNEVVFHIDAMRGGDLTTNPRAWGSDEAARLMRTLAGMQAELRRIVGQVRGASGSIVVASTQIAGGALNLSARTEQSAASLEQTASAMAEVSATVQRGAETVQQATQLAVANADAAERGGRVVAQVVQTMQGINASSGRIGDIIGTIDGIAFQTNILALNAAVEAARAGEQGRGFAVVAAEVRALAQRSGAAAREIKALITASVKQVEGGVHVVQEAGSTMDEMMASAQRVRELLEGVAEGAREQTQGVLRTAGAVRSLDEATQQNAALVEQTAAAAAQLKDQALGLAAEVAQFKLPA